MVEGVIYYDHDYNKLYTVILSLKTTKNDTEYSLEYGLEG